MNKQRTTPLFICLGLAVLVVCSYGRMLTAGFVNFDDDRYIINNPFVSHGLTLTDIRWAFGFGDVGYWHPMTWLSLMLDATIAGLNPGFFHTTNLILHATGTILLFLWLARATGTIWRSAMVAALFALHPANVESVAWIVERKNVLSFVFFMLTLISYAHYVSKPSRWRYLGTLALFALGLLAKPAVLVLPGILFLIDLWPLERLNRNGSLADIPKRFLTLLLEKTPFALLSLVSAVVAKRSLELLNSVTHYGDIGLAFRLKYAPVCLLEYVRLLFWPSGLICFRPYPHAVSIGRTVVSVAILAAITAAILLQYRRRPYLFVGWFWFIGALLPVLGLIQGGLWPATADRFLYIPAIGIFIAIVWLCGDLWPTYSRRLASLALVACASITFIQTGYWQNGRALFQHAVDIQPDNYFANNNLGNELMRSGERSQAIQHFQISVEAKPSYAAAWNNLGVALAEEGYPKDAFQCFSQAMGDDPTYDDALNNWGIVLFRSGNFAEAITRFKAALKLNPASEDAQRNLKAAEAKLP